MKNENNSSANITISLNKEKLHILNKLCELEHRKRCNQIIHMMEFYIDKNNLDVK